MTQFSKLYLKLDKEKEHLITFNYSEKYSICRQGVCSRQGCSGQSMKGLFQLSLFLFVPIEVIGWLVYTPPIPGKLSIQTFSFQILVRIRIE